MFRRDAAGFTLLELLVVLAIMAILTAMAMGYQTKPSFAVENEKAISSAPKVDFGSPAPAAQ